MTASTSTNCKPLVPWIGGKRKLAKHLLPMFPKHTCYVEPFCGAAALFFVKEPSKHEVLNDINGDLTNLYRVVQHHTEELYRQFKWSLTSRQIFKWLQVTDPTTLTDIQRAARFLYLQKNAFGGMVAGQSFGVDTQRSRGINFLTIEQDLCEAHLRMQNTTIENLSWHEVIKRYDRDYTLFYCDPPYWKTAGYGVTFGIEQYEQLAELARTIKGKMIISINDHKDMQRVFKGFKKKAVNYAYTNGNSARAANKQAVELIYKSW